MPNNHVGLSRNQRRGNTRNVNAVGQQRRARGPDRYKWWTTLVSCLTGSSIGLLFKKIWTFFACVHSNMKELASNDELLRQSNNVGRNERKQFSYDLQYSQLTISLLISRFLSVIVVSTVFVPDEYWQGTEVAYWLVFGKGHLTWEWAYGLRGFLYPCILAVPLWIMKQSNFVISALVPVAPRLLQAAVTCLAEYKFMTYVRKKFGNESGIMIYGLVVTNWFLIYCCSRTLTNTMEMDLNLLAFYYLENDSLGAFTGFACLAFCIRPTSIVIWIPSIFGILVKFYKNSLLFAKCLTVGATIFFTNALVDVRLHKRFVLPFWKFFQFNFLEGKSAEFGTHPILWYVYSALPSIFGPIILWVFLGLLMWPPKYSVHLRTSIAYICIFSGLAHKEIRFLLPVVPHLLVVAGDCITCMYHTAKNLKHGIWKYMRTMLYINLIAHLGSTVFFGQFHQVGIKQAAHEILSDSRLSSISNVNVWILMPCYSVPVHTYLHLENATYEYLSCTPPGINTDAPNPQVNDFSEFNLEAFIWSKIANPRVPSTKPNYVMTYAKRTPEILTLLKNHGLDYFEMGKYFHTVFPFDNVGKNVLVLRYNDTTAPALRTRLPKQQ